MKDFLTMFKVEIERWYWFLLMMVLIIGGTVLAIAGTLKPGAYFIGMCILCGLNYIAAIIKQSKIEKLTKTTKQLLTETQDTSPLALSAELDGLNRLIKDAAPLLKQMRKTMPSDKTKITNNNNPHLL